MKRISGMELKEDCGFDENDLARDGLIEFMKNNLELN